MKKLEKKDMKSVKGGAGFIQYYICIDTCRVYTSQSQCRAGCVGSSCVGGRICP